MRGVPNLKVFAVFAAVSVSDSSWGMFVVVWAGARPWAGVQLGKTWYIWLLLLL